MHKKTLSYPCYSKPPRDISAHEKLLDMYRNHLVQMRGVFYPKNNVQVATCFLSLLDASECSLEDVSAAHIQTFITEQGFHYQRKTMASIASYLRSFLRYLAFNRLLPKDISGSVKRPYMFQGEREPRYLQDWQVRRILDSVDRSTSTGKRDYAMLLLLAVYGLRAKEVAGLHLDDIRWVVGKLLVRSRKCGDPMELPLTNEASEALVTYLRVRPQSDSRVVFLNDFHPNHPVVADRLGIVARKFIRSNGFNVAHPGSHTFRYSRAQALFVAQYPLSDIASALGHRDLRTTLGYLSFTVHPLREVAINAGEELA
ncbi:MAG: tyrosine-type recombinase/integrase [Candidatus Hatepunaea meridiana]|nr:tyrosine-type recombinase/integrase [Candidatus Hatepunaea meridiana]